MKIGDEVYIHGYVDEIRQNVVIIRNEGGYFGTVPEEIRSSSEIPNTCGDAISRQEVLNAITMAEVRWQAVDNVNKLPSVTPQQMTLTSSEKPNKWIPVSERLPEKRKKCLVTFRGGYVGIMCYAPDLYGVDEYDFCDEKGMAGWYDYDGEWGHYSRDDVIAWLPIEPYKAESEDKE